MDETTERAARAAFNDLADSMGPEQFKELTLRFLLEMEPQLRQTMSPDSEPIRMLDEYHRLNG